jgi:L-alanine-DL-glutamate epimerase-like enolase superfamily enzyme
MTLYEALAELPVTIDGYRLEPLSQATPKFTRHSTVVALQGNGHVGRGEDISYSDKDQDAHRALAPLPLAGTRTLGEWSELVDGLDLMPEAPEQHAAIDYRRWAYDSALLDLALRQAGRSLAQAVGREARPVRFCISPSTGLERWLELYPTSELKLDADDDWDERRIGQLAATGRVAVVDLKLNYGKDYVVEHADAPGLARRVRDGLPDVVIEDPASTGAVWDELAGEAARISFDAPVHSLADLQALPRTGWLNVKPSRFGTTRRLLETIEHCERNDVRMYGGGQYELGIGRSQIQTVASIFYADGPNDVAPGGYNAPEAVTGLPTSPLPAAGGIGFGSER